MTEPVAISRRVGLLGNGMNSGYSASPSSIVALRASSMCRMIRSLKTWLRFSEESVPAKEKKTRADLVALLIRELRKLPECDSVARVTITQPVPSAPHHWDVAWTVGSNQVLCPAALRIASELQAKFDLA